MIVDVYGRKMLIENSKAQEKAYSPTTAEKHLLNKRLADAISSGTSLETHAGCGRATLDYADAGLKTIAIEKDPVRAMCLFKNLKGKVNLLRKEAEKVKYGAMPWDKIRLVDVDPYNEANFVMLQIIPYLQNAYVQITTAEAFGWMLHWKDEYQWIRLAGRYGEFFWKYVRGKPPAKRIDPIGFMPGVLIPYWESKGMKAVHHFESSSQAGRMIFKKGKVPKVDFSDREKVFRISAQKMAAARKEHERNGTK